MINKRIISIIILFFLCIIVFNFCKINDMFMYERFSNLDGTDLDETYGIFNNNDNINDNINDKINDKINDNDKNNNINDKINDKNNNINDNNNDNINDNNNNNDKNKCDKNKCDIKKCGENLHPILDPKYNMREASKQCLLLEDHLNNSKKRCIDCIKKHFLMVDGLLEEAVSLEKDNDLRETYRNRYLEWVKLEKEYVNDIRNDRMDNISKKIRIFRKPLMEEYFDSVSEYSV